MLCKTNREIFDTTVQNGEVKAGNRGLRSWLLAFLAGAYIAVGAFLALRVGGALPVEIWGSLGKLIFAVVFPTGLMLVLLCGADLFTGNCMTLTASCSCGKITLKEAIIGGCRSWLGNFAGAVFVAVCLAWLSGLIFDTVSHDGKTIMPWAGYAVNMANTKCQLAFMDAFWRGVGCNWLVCLAVYAATAATDVPGKILALWIPTTAFVALGMEHCIANMFFIPLGIIAGSDSVYLDMSAVHPPLEVGWYQFIVHNLIPVTLGNIVGGAVLVAGIYAMVYRNRNTASGE